MAESLEQPSVLLPSSSLEQLLRNRMVLVQELRIHKVLEPELRNHMDQLLSCSIQRFQDDHEDASEGPYGMDRLELLRLSVSYGKQFP